MKSERQTNTCQTFVAEFKVSNMTGLFVSQVKESLRLQREADDLQREAERSELSLDELTTLRQLEAKLGHALGQTEGPMIPEVM